MDTSMVIIDILMEEGHHIACDAFPYETNIPVLSVFIVPTEIL
jgi:hypothetical protein